MKSRFIILRFAVIFLSYYKCLPLYSQDLVTIDDDDWTLFTKTEARLDLSSGFTVVPSFLYARNNNFSEYRGSFIGVLLAYEREKWGKFSLDETYISLNGSLSGNLLQVEWQKIWSSIKIRPILRLTAGQLYLEDLKTSEKFLLNYRTRIRLGIIPKLNKKLSLFLMDEWFPTQKEGFSKENRIITGLMYDLSTSLQLNFAYLSRYRDRSVSATTWQNIVLFGFVYKAKLVSKKY